MSSKRWSAAPYLPGSHSLYSPDGRRKYLNQSERRAFLDAAASEDQPTHTLCLTLAYTGCRISEALSLTRSSVQPGVNVIAIRTLKKRGRVMVREIPVPDELVRLLLHDQENGHSDTPLWPFGRTFAWRQVKSVMTRAGIDGPYASPRGLRHGFAVSAVLAGVPLTLIQKWLGHANLTTTAIYADATGPEEREMARRMWT
ncbi:MAG: site-specific integrase [Rhizobiaceae bacterium]|nr:site-specific integrase [Rhizobiaceae bacterium]